MNKNTKIFFIAILASFVISIISDSINNPEEFITSFNRSFFNQ